MEATHQSLLFCLQQLLTTSSSAGMMKLSDDDAFSPVGLKVLVVDDDPCCLMLLDRMLRECKYHVVTCNRAAKALCMLRDRDEAFDLVISDVHMPDMDGFKLLELIGLEMDLPVIMMSANDDTGVVMKGITYGACDYLVKPVRIEELRNIWQHVVRRRKELGCGRDDALLYEEWDDRADQGAVDNSALRKRKLHCTSADIGDSSMQNINSLKKSRVVWSFELHQQFVKAINSIGIDKAVPKRILEVMNIRGLTRENVASHLQKYRLYLKRLSGVNPEPFPIASFQAYEGSVLGGTMKVQKAVPTSRCNTSIFHKGLSQFDAGTLASLTRLQALQQDAHEKGQILDSSLMAPVALQNILVDHGKEQHKLLLPQSSEFCTVASVVLPSDNSLIDPSSSITTNSDFSCHWLTF